MELEQSGTDHGMGTGERVLVLGASGYVGGRLVPRLLAAGYEVRCLARTPRKLTGLPWADDVEIVEGDLLTDDTVAPAFAGVDVVYHLVHSMGSAAGFEDADRRIARTVGAAARVAGVRRIVYLGGLGEIDEDTSPHLRSRAEVGETLTASGVPTTILRAAVIIGSGSASFEMLRHLVEKLPVMVTPRWVDTRVQPIAIRDVLRYLVAVIADPADRANHDYDIGGPDVLTYLDMMQVYARVSGLPRRLVVKVPLLTPGLSSHWVNLVTPVPFGIAQPLVSSLVSEVVVRPGGEDIAAVAPGSCVGYEEALRLALRRVGDAEVTTSWREAELAGRSPAEPYPGDPAWSGGTLLVDAQQITVDAPANAVFASVSRIGGDRGWPTAMWAWQVRGLIDRLIGGVGLRRGRRDPDELRVGDALDFWRVEAVEEPRGGARSGLVRLRAEMKLPGRAWLEFRLAPAPGSSGTVLTQRALFAPKGLIGRLYWYVMLPFHALIFRSMVERLAADAETIGRYLTSSGGPTAPLAVRAGDGGQRRRPRARRAG
jgi:uncharacterized protein YbjT (DUF2867 family)